MQGKAAIKDSLHSIEHLRMTLRYWIGTNIHLYLHTPNQNVYPYQVSKVRSVLFISFLKEGVGGCACADMKVFMDVPRRRLSVVHCLDGGLSNAGEVSATEHPRFTGPHGLDVHFR